MKPSCWTKTDKRRMLITFKSLRGNVDGAKQIHWYQQNLIKRGRSYKAQVTPYEANGARRHMRFNGPLLPARTGCGRVKYRAARCENMAPKRWRSGGGVSPWQQASTRNRSKGEAERSQVSLHPNAAHTNAPEFGAGALRAICRSGVGNEVHGGGWR